MERNFRIRNSRPLMPSRTWRKNTGPRLVALIAIAVTEQDGRRQQQQEPGAEDVDGPFHQSRQLAEPGLLQPEQRQPLDGADVHARAGDLGEGGRHDQPAARAFQLPAELAHADRAEAVTGHCDDVGVDPFGGYGCVTHAADHRDARRDLAAERQVLDARADDPQARTDGALGDAEQVPDRIGRPDGDDAVRPLAAPAVATDEGADRRASDEQQDDPGGDDADDVAAGDVELEGVTDDRERADHDRGGAEDPLGLFRPGREVSDLVPAAGLQRDVQATAMTPPMPR